MCTLCVLQTLPRLLGSGGVINQIKLLDQELWRANMNHIAGTTSYSRGIKGNMPASHSLCQQCDTSLQHGHPLQVLFLPGVNKTITFVSSQSLAVKPAYRQSVWCYILKEYCLTKHLAQGRGVASAVWKGWRHCPGNLSESLLTWIFHLQHTTQSDTTLLPMT